MATVSTPNTPNPAGPWEAMVGATGSRLGPDTETGGTVSTPNTPNPAGPWAAMVGATGSRYLEIAVAHIDALVAVDLAVAVLVVHISSCCNPLHPQHPQSCQPVGGICWGYWELIGMLRSWLRSNIHRWRGRALQPVAPARKRR